MEDRALLVAAYWRTNLTMRQLAPLFGVSKSAADRVIDHLGPMLALQPRKRFAKDTVLIVDGTLVPRARTAQHAVPTRSQRTGRRVELSGKASDPWPADEDFRLVRIPEECQMTRPPLPGQPLPDVHAVHGDAGQDLGLTGLAVFVGQQFAECGVAEVRLEGQHPAVPGQAPPQRHQFAGVSDAARGIGVRGSWRGADGP